VIICYLFIVQNEAPEILLDAPWVALTEVALPKEIKETSVNVGV
jgi:hypothetical protein